LAVLSTLGIGSNHSIEEQQRIGKMVLEIHEALDHPEQAESLETIANYGTLSEHCFMIRG